MRRQIQMVTPSMAGASTTRHTPDCLAERLAEMEPRLRKRFPAVAADCGLDAACDAGLNYIERVQKGQASELDCGGAWLWCAAVRGALRCLEKELPCFSIDVAMPPAWPEGAMDRDRSDLVGVRKALEQLSVRQKDAVCLHVILGLSLRRAARQMDIAPQTLAGHLKAAFAQMRTTLSAPSKRKEAAGAGAFAS
jgi:hypothetical protein